MPSLAGAHKGYLHQDIVTALALASLLLPRTADRRVRADKKRFEGDVFDDLTLEGLKSRRVQIKSHSTAERMLKLADLATTAIDFPLDYAVRSFLADPEPPDEYRLLVTFDGPADDLLPYLVPAQDVDALLPGITTTRFRLSLDRVWPSDGEAWRRIRDLDRSEVGEFLNRFVIEIGCPTSSRDLRHPGPLDDVLMTFLSDRIGVTHPPNQHMDLANAAAHLILRAQLLRAGESDGSANDVTAALRLKVDYDRVEEVLPLDPHRLVNRSEEVAAITSALEGGGRLVVTGPPGAGKSWLLHLVRDALVADGWVVALHFCFVDLLDQARQQRTTITTMFGSLIAELLDADPDLATDLVPRYAAGPGELETILRVGLEENPDRRIAIVVDGLDHANRVASPSVPGAAADIAQELAALALPAGVALVVGSQPGDHLSALGGKLQSHTVSPWERPELETLADQLGVGTAAEASEVAVGPVIDVIAERSRGNPLHATYLSRTVTEALAADAGRSLSTTDVVELTQEAPPFDANLDAYYGWLLEALKDDAGAIYVAHLMAVLDFAVTADDLIEIYPILRTLISGVISRLAPVLADEPAMGGLRVYHESFQRYVRQRAEDSGTDLTAVVAPAIDWLESRGFEKDKRAFRSLFGLMQVAGRHSEVVDRVGVDFVSRAVVDGQPGDAVMANLRLAASSAASIGSWSDLARLIEVARSADYLYHWRLNDESLAEAYGRGYAALRGAAALGDRLLHDGRCTFLPRPGLLLCELCEELGVTAPWSEYLAAHDHLLKTDDTLYAGGEPAIRHARLVGELRVAGFDGAVDLAQRWLASSADAPVHSLDVARAIGDLYGDDALSAVLDKVAPGPIRAWVVLACAERADDDDRAASLAAEAVAAGLPNEGLRLASWLGAAIDGALEEAPDLLALTKSVKTNDVRLHDDLMERWLIALDIATAIGDDVGLNAAEAVIPSDSWYRRWLKFTVLLHRGDVHLSVILSELEALSHDIRIFEGEPRVVDLYPIHRDIQASFRTVLMRVEDDDMWCAAADSLARISSETTSWLQGSRSGPLPVDEFLELLMSTASSDRRALAAAEHGKRALHPDERSGEYYDTHAADQILLARLLLGAGDLEGAEAAWAEAACYLPGYGFRKDVTVFEVLENLSAIATVRPDMLSLAVKQLHPIVEGVLVHTDGKETRWAIHHWIDAAGEHDPASALVFLGRRGLEHAPSFGDLDHGMAGALATLTPVVEAEVAVAGWIGIGSEARERSGQAVAAGESEPITGWDIIVGSVVGDGTGPPNDSAEAIVGSAARLGKALPVVFESEREAPVSDGGVPHEDAPPQEFVIQAGAAPLEVARAVRRWRDVSSSAAATAVVEAAANYMLALVRDGRASEAEVLLGRLARDTPMWDRRELLRGLADALLAEGPPRLAAIAATYAYTRTSDGWHRFGGEKHQALFLAALESDREVALMTLMSEVADAVGTGGDMGVNRHLVELLALAGLPDETWAAWSEARAAIERRLPAVGDVDVIEIDYEVSVAGPEAALACALLARLNHVLVFERRAAVVGLARLIRRPGGACADALAMAAEHAPASVLTTLLSLLEEHEPAPFDCTVASVEALTAIASGPWVVARVLARRLLDRIAVPVPAAPSATLLKNHAIPGSRIRQLAGYFAQARLDPVEAEWDEFTVLAAQSLEAALKTDELKGHMQRLRRRMIGGRVGHRPKLWWPIDEEQEEILQRVGASARANLAASGDIDPTVELRVARALLADVRLGELLAASRCPRPDYRPRPSEHLRGDDDAEGPTIKKPDTVPEGDYQDWLVVAHHEEELIVGDGFGSPVAACVDTWSCLAFADHPGNLEGRLPVGYGDPELWTEVCETTPAVFGGPLAGYQVRRDSFGAIGLLTPHEILIAANDLRPVAPSLGLALTDASGHVAMRLRDWRENTLGEDDHLDDWEHRIVGVELIARPDVVEAVRAFAVAKDLVSVSTSTERPRRSI